MNRKIFIYVGLAVLLVLFAFGSLYVPKTEVTKTVEKLGTTVSEAQFSKDLAVNEMGLHLPDYIIVVVYAVVIVALGLFASRTKKGHEKDEKDYFLAGKSLPWWVVGSSLIAANISAEQFIGTSGSGFAIGLAIASYEWMSALTLIIVGKYFLPIFIKEGIYTIPEFVEKRYNRTLKTILSVFWLALFTFVNLTSVLYLGARAMSAIIPGLDLIHCILILAFFAAAYSLWGGLSAVAWTDVIQVVCLTLGGIITTIVAVDKVGGLGTMIAQFPSHFEMILGPENPEFNNLPGIGVLLGGMWVANLYYWGFNQYIIQRTFAAKSLAESQKGIAFAAVLKMIMPIIVVLPGIAAYILFQDGKINMPVNDNGGIINDSAYSVLIGFLPVGLRGIAFAALLAAVVSSLASMINSISTIFTMDIYKEYIGKNASSKKLVNIGRIAAVVSLLIGVAIAPLMKNMSQGFQYIQEYTGLVSPPILAVFLLGLFWKKTTTKGAIIGVIVGTLFSLGIKIFSNAVPEAGLPFMHQMGVTCLVTLAVIAAISLIENRGKDNKKFIVLEKGLFKTHSAFNVIAFGVIIVLCALYAVFWNSATIRSVFKLDETQIKERIIEAPKAKQTAAESVAAGETTEVSASEIQAVPAE